LPQRSTVFDYEPAREYTFIGACDVNGFIEEACDAVMRGSGMQHEIGSDLTGTVGTERVELWIEECLVPILGDFVKGEPRSVVILDNASVHHSQKIQDLITGAGAIILYLSPYSPDKNPIELMFNEWKKVLRRQEFNPSWYDTHIQGVRAITHAMARAFFRHCGVPGCEGFSSSREAAVAGDEGERRFAAAAATAVAVWSFVVKRRRRQEGAESQSESEDS
jgi:hypothetical protein